MKTSNIGVILLIFVIGIVGCVKPTTPSQSPAVSETSAVTTDEHEVLKPVIEGPLAGTDEPKDEDQTSVEVEPEHEPMEQLAETTYPTSDEVQPNSEAKEQPAETAAETLADRSAVAYRYLLESARFGPRIVEHLVDERGLLAAEFNRLIAEVMPPEILLPLSDDASVNDCLIVARVYERAGNFDESRKALRKALDRTALIPEEWAFAKRESLQRIAVTLARQGDFDGAAKAAAAIDATAEDSVELTGRGVVEVSANAGQSYALMLVTAMQLDADAQSDGSVRYQAAVKLAEKIPGATAKAAAYWMIAMRQAEDNRLADALVTADLASEVEPRRPPGSEPSMVVEFTTEGPNPVPLKLYSTLALGRIAQQQALTGNDAGAVASVKRIGDRDLEDATIVELVTVLVEQGKPEFVNRWSDRIKADHFRSSALYHLAEHQLRSGDFDKMEKTAKAIRSPSLRARMRMDFIEYLLDSKELGSLPKQIEVAQRAVEEIDPARAEAFVELGQLQARADDRQAAIKTFLLAAKAAQKYEDPLARTQGLAEIAVALALAGGEQESKETMSAALDGVRTLDEISRSHAVLAVVQQQLKVDVSEAIEELARSIPDPSARSEALSVVAASFAERGEFEASRAPFAAAFEVAMEVEDFLGLNTRYSKGGAIRYLAREQAQCDHLGLSKYLAKSESVKIQAYGYLGSAESFVPAAVQYAQNRGSDYPNGLLDKLSNERLLPQLLSSLERHEAPQPAGDVEADVQSGLAHLSEKKFDEAIADFSHAIEAIPDEAAFYLFRGSAWNAKDEYDAAIADFTRAIQLNPDLAEALAYRGVSWLKKEDAAKALTDFDTALEVNPQCEVALINRGSYWKERGNYARALADYKQALEINPRRHVILNAVAEILATCPDSQFRDGKEAFRFASRACTISEWENHEYLATFAAAHAESGNFESAVRWQQRAIDMAPSDLKGEAQRRLDLYRTGKPYRTVEKGIPKSAPEG